MKILITGGAGFIGSNLADKLIGRGHSVSILDNLSTGKRENLNPGAFFYEKDIQDPNISEIFEKEKVEIVFHFAAQIDIRKSVNDPVESAKTNILGTLNILENCKKYGVKKIIFSSSGGAIYGDAEIIPTPEDHPLRPASPYGIEKLIAESYLDFYKKEYGLDYLVLRFANVYGPRQNPEGEAGVISIFCDKILAGRQPVICGDGKQTRDFVFIDDVLNAALCFDKSGVFNIGTSKETDVNTIFSEIQKFLGSNFKESHADQKPGEQKRSCLDVSRAKIGLGWVPEYEIAPGIRKTCDWFKNLTAND